MAAGLPLIGRGTPATFQGPNPSPGKIPGVVSGPPDAAGQAKIDAALDLLDSHGHTQVRDAINNGIIGPINELHFPHPQEGIHDHDTIAVNTEGRPPEVIATAILHEYRHAENARADGTSVDTRDDVGGVPCVGICAHAAMNVQSALDFCSMTEPGSTACRDWEDKIRENAVTWVIDCVRAAGGCGYDGPLPPTDQSCC